MLRLANKGIKNMTNNEYLDQDNKNNSRMYLYIYTGKS